MKKTQIDNHQLFDKIIDITLFDGVEGLGTSYFTTLRSDIVKRQQTKPKYCFKLLINVKQLRRFFFSF